MAHQYMGSVCVWAWRRQRWSMCEWLPERLTEDSDHLHAANAFLISAWFQYGLLPRSSKTKVHALGLVEKKGAFEPVVFPRQKGVSWRHGNHSVFGKGRRKQPASSCMLQGDSLDSSKGPLSSCTGLKRTPSISNFLSIFCRRRDIESNDLLGDRVRTTVQVALSGGVVSETWVFMRIDLDSGNKHTALKVVVAPGRKYGRNPIPAALTATQHRYSGWAMAYVKPSMRTHPACKVRRELAFRRAVIPAELCRHETFIRLLCEAIKRRV